MSTISNLSKSASLLQLYGLRLDELLQRATNVAAENLDNSVEFCSIINAKSGKCCQNCKYCAQSSHYRTNIETYPLVSLDEVRKCAQDARNNGATRFSIVTSGRTPDDGDIDTLCKMVEIISGIDGLYACASLGFMTEKQLLALKDAGMTRYHHNLNSCKSYYKNVCTTHTYEERVETIKLAKKCGLEVCVGGIIGMGETKEQRIELGLEIAELEPASVPVNFLHPVAGTPFEVHNDAIDEEEILKTLAIYRIIMPKTSIRYAGGRKLRLSEKGQELGLKAGVNGLMIGNYLTTTGIPPEEDRQLVAKAGKTV